MKEGKTRDRMTHCLKVFALSRMCTRVMWKEEMRAFWLGSLNPSASNPLCTSRYRSSTRASALSAHLQLTEGCLLHLRAKSRYPSEPPRRLQFYLRSLQAARQLVRSGIRPPSRNLRKIITQRRAPRRESGALKMEREEAGHRKCLAILS